MFIHPSLLTTWSQFKVVNPVANIQLLLLSNLHGYAITLVQSALPEQLFVFSKQN